ncbi:MAG: 16S rRNA (cytosine(967)-C(5))-methyltransferase RsmB [Azospirillaceae bacterium]
MNQVDRMVPEDGEAGIAPRRAALAVLSAVIDRGVPLAQAFERHGLALEPRDRAFLQTLVATTLRRYGQIDRLVSGFLTKPLPERSQDVSHLLRLGIAQLLFLGVPPHAAVATSVTLAKRIARGRFSGLVNAVLRRVTREGPDRIARQDAARLNTPDWLWRRWASTYGEAKARAIAEVNMLEPSLDISVRSDAALWAERLEGRLLPTGTIRRANAPVTGLPGFAEGAWWVQDAGAALPARLLGDVASLQVLDMCAAPGGKTMQLAAAGAFVTAVDMSAERLDRVAQNLARVQLSASLVVADASRYAPGHPFDAVLLDAPCSATGTVRRHPDLPWTKSPADIAQQVPRQAALLESAASLLRPGGLLVWSTCSLEPEEGEAQIARFLAARPAFARVPVEPLEIGGLADSITPAGEVRTLPCHAAAWGGIDGFHIARLRRLA